MTLRSANGASRPLSAVTAMVLAAATLWLIWPTTANAATVPPLSPPGTVVAWGYNNFGQTNVPAGLSHVVAISAGDEHSLALKSDGTVVAWGLNDYGQTNVPAGLSNVVAIAAGGYFSLALKSDGTVVGWGSNYLGQTRVPAGLSNVTAISAGSQHGLALKSDGTVVAWGYNENGQTRVPAGLSNVTAISAGSNHSLALKSDGTVVGWGTNGFGESSVPAGLSNVRAVSAGGSDSMVLKSDGTVVAWGYNNYGQTNVPTGLTNVTAISAGAAHMVALKSDGTVVGWGSNLVGEASPPTELSSVTAIDAGYYDTVALTSPLPTTPTGFSITKDEDARTATITWQPPTLTASPITGYRVARDAGTLPGKTPWSKVVGPDARSQTFLNLTPGSTYTLSVQAINAAGTGPAASGPVTITVPMTNLLKNPGFELDVNADSRPDSWTSSSKFTRSNASVYSGSYAGRHRATDNAGHTITQVVGSLTSGVNYGFSGRVSIPATTDAFTFQIRVRWRNSANGVIRTDVVRRDTAATNGWNQVLRTMTSPTGTTNAQVQMVATSLNATVYVDDFTFSRS